MSAPQTQHKGVVYGEDRPPGLPDVFGVNAALRRAVTGNSDGAGGGRRSVEGMGGVQ